MRPTLLKTLVLLLISVQSFAQLQNGTVLTQTITGTDITSGENLDLFEMLDDGKTVIVDVYATWCGPCWSIHQSGLLEILNQQYGPTGTDQIRVIAAEIDDDTSLADIQGTGSNTFGDWREGITYNMIDNSSWASYFQTISYPSIFVIRPDRRVMYMYGPLERNYIFNQIWWDKILGVGNYEEDLFVINNRIPVSTCENQQLNFEGMFLNTGQSAITEAVLRTEHWTNYNGSFFGLQTPLDNNINFSGNVGVFNYATINSETIIADETGALLAFSNSINGTELQIDQIHGDGSVGFIPTIENNILQLRIYTDYYPSETSGRVVDEMGNIVFEFGPFNPGPDAYGGGGNDALTEHIFDIELPGNPSQSSCYGVEIFDDFGDGLTQVPQGINWQPGYNLYNNDIELIRPSMPSDTLNFGMEYVFEFKRNPDPSQFDMDMDGITSDLDCDDTNPDVYPGNTETPYNGIDDDCDPSTLDDDLDGDGYGIDEDCDDMNEDINPGEVEILNNDIDEDCDGVAAQIDFDGDGWNNEEDCDESDPNINPGAEEIPNNDVDEDCDGVALVIDDDGDGFNSDEDCDDNNADINPDAMEIVNNGIDDNCDGIIEEIDEDGDGFNSDEDCDDNDPDINPGQVEIPNNDVDENCDGELGIVDNDGDGYSSDEDCDDSNADVNPGETEIPNNDIDEDCDGEALVIDDDGDGYNSDEDCDDSDASINPDATEIPNNDVDEDCDGIAQIIDNDGDGFNSDEDCDDNDAGVNPGQMEIPNNDIDEDCDGEAVVIDDDGDGYNSDEDCDDANADINPGAEEIPNNDVDEDCDGEAVVIDDDGDGYNSDEDCDDSNADVNPGAEEIPNNDIDEDCDGEAVVIDDDGDGYNSDEDCDDANADINPGAEEIPNNDVDEDCDGEALVIDDDGDGFNSDEDCDDTNPDINPDAEEIANNGIDEDCDGMDLVSGTHDLGNVVLSVYPNPVDEILFVSMSEQNTIAYRLLSIDGKLVKSNTQSATDFQIDVSELLDGIYLLHITDNKGNTLTERIMID